MPDPIADAFLRSLRRLKRAKTITDITGDLESTHGKLPFSTVGQGRVHANRGLDHTNAADLAIDPDSPEGQEIMTDLGAKGIPYLPSNGTESWSTGKHIHIGDVSQRAGQYISPGTTRERLYQIASQVAEPSDSIAAALQRSRQRLATPPTPSKEFDQRSGELLKPSKSSFQQIAEQVATPTQQPLPVLSAGTQDGKDFSLWDGKSSLTQEAQAQPKTLPPEEAPYVAKLDAEKAFTPEQFNQAERQRLRQQPPQMRPDVRTLDLPYSQRTAEPVPEENAPQARKLRVGARNWQDLSGANLTASVIATMPLQDQEAARYVFSLVPKGDQSDIWTNDANIEETSVNGKRTGYAATVGIPKWVEVGIEAYKQGGAAAVHRAIQARMAAEEEYAKAVSEKEKERQAQLAAAKQEIVTDGTVGAVGQNVLAPIVEEENKLAGGLKGIAGALAGKLGLDTIDRSLTDASRENYQDADLYQQVARESAERANLSPVTTGIAQGVGSLPAMIPKVIAPGAGALATLVENANQPIDQALGRAFQSEMSGLGLQAIQSLGLAEKFAEMGRPALQIAARTAEGSALNTLLASPELLSQYQQARTPQEKQAVLSELVTAAVVGAIQPNLPKWLGGGGLPTRAPKISPLEQMMSDPQIIAAHDAIDQARVTIADLQAKQAKNQQQQQAGYMPPYRNIDAQLQQAMAAHDQAAANFDTVLKSKIPTSFSNDSGNWLQRLWPPKEKAATVNAEPKVASPEVKASESVVTSEAELDTLLKSLEETGETSPKSLPKTEVPPLAVESKPAPVVASNQPKPEETAPSIKPLRRGFRAGMNNAEIVFDSDLHRDLYDIGANARYVQNKTGQRPHRDDSAMIESVARQLGTDRAGVLRVAGDVYNDTRAQMKGVGDLETRNVKLNLPQEKPLFAGGEKDSSKSESLVSTEQASKPASQQTSKASEMKLDTDLRAKLKNPRWKPFNLDSGGRDASRIASRDINLPSKPKPTFTTESTATRTSVPLEKIWLGEKSLNREKLLAATENLKNGFKESSDDPVILARDPKNPDNFIVMAGDHRIAALKLMDFNGNVPVIIREPKAEAKAAAPVKPLFGEGITRDPEYIAQQQRANEKEADQRWMQRAEESGSRGMSERERRENVSPIALIRRELGTINPGMLMGEGKHLREGGIHGLLSKKGKASINDARELLRDSGYRLSDGRSFDEAFDDEVLSFLEEHGTTARPESMADFNNEQKLADEEETYYRNKEEQSNETTRTEDTARNPEQLPSNQPDRVIQSKNVGNEISDASLERRSTDEAGAAEPDAPDIEAVERRQPTDEEIDAMARASEPPKPEEGTQHFLPEAKSEDEAIPQLEEADLLERRYLQELMAARAARIGDRKENVGKFGKLRSLAEKSLISQSGEALAPLAHHPEWSTHLDITPDATPQQVLDAIAQDLVNDSNVIRASQMSPDHWRQLLATKAGNWSENLKETVASTLAASDLFNSRKDEFLADPKVQALLEAPIPPRGQAARIRDLHQIAERYNGDYEATNITRHWIETTLKLRQRSLAESRTTGDEGRIDAPNEQRAENLTETPQTDGRAEPTAQGDFRETPGNDARDSGAGTERREPQAYAERDQQGAEQVAKPLTLSDQINQAGREAATSPHNDLPEPTEAQKEAGNYKKSHVELHGLDISIENPAGSVRSGIGANGESWSVTMQNHYGYIRSVDGEFGVKGADKEHLDVYIGEHPESEKVFVIDQVDAETAQFDEHKVILGATDKVSAEQLYDAHFDDGRGKERRGAITEMDMPAFKDWLKNGNTKSPVRYEEQARTPDNAPLVKPEGPLRAKQISLDWGSFFEK